MGDVETDFTAKRLYRIAQGFYEADPVKRRCKKSNFWLMVYFGPGAGNNPPSDRGFGVCGGGGRKERRGGQTPKAISLFGAMFVGG
jgi:hypothetical protein